MPCHPWPGDCLRRILADAGGFQELRHPWRSVLVSGEAIHHFPDADRSSSAWRALRQESRKAGSSEDISASISALVRTSR